MKEITIEITNYCPTNAIITVPMLELENK